MKISLSGIKWKYQGQKGKDWLDSTGYHLEAARVKAAAHRGVYRHEDGIYIKIFRYPFFRSLFRSTKRAKACREGRVLLRLQELGIVSPEVMAFGEKRWFGCLRQDALITRELPDLIPIPEYIENSFRKLSALQKRRLISAFASTIKNLHQSGVYHRDLNFGNMFIRSHEGNVHFAVLDVDKVKFYSKSIPKRLCIRNLGDFFQMFYLLTTVPERFNFMKSYGIEDWRLNQKQIIAGIEKRALKTIRKIGKALYRKCHSRRGGFVREKTDDYVVHYFRSPATRDLAHIIRNPGILIKNSEADPDANASSGTIVSMNNRSYLLKQYTSDASKTWSAIWGGFITIRFPVLQPLIYFEKNHSTRGEKRCSYILYEDVPGAEPLRNKWPHISADEKNRLLARISFFIGYMHQSGIYHGNLSWDSILVQTDETGSKILFRNFENSHIFWRMKLQQAKSDLNPFLADLKKFDNNSQRHDLFIKSLHKRAHIKYQ